MSLATREVAEAVDLQVQEHPPDLTTAADRLLHVYILMSLATKEVCKAVDLKVHDHPPDLTTAADQLLHVWTRHIKIAIKAATTKV